MNMPIPQPRTLLTPKQAAKRANVSVRFLERRRKDGAGPQVQKIGSRVGYWDDVVDAWINASTYRSTSEYGDR